ncbi:MAG: efflux transporter periplasmic adaptor subunit [Bacteroidetes bacterium MedPE-SWsnd-G2]|nr:MAG: efflux transporter periplasmic adaptor subunit [Bacteroidetes bacterium MedPE-SWsnd-G2]
MKKIYSILLITLVLTSCGKKEKPTEEIIAGNDLKEIKKHRQTLVDQQQILLKDIKSLDQAIERIDPEQKLTLVTTSTVKTEEFHHYLELQGNVQTKKNIVIFPEMNGIMAKVYVKEGDNVKKGQLLASIDDGGLSQQLAQLEIQTELAKTTFERQQRLWQQEIGSEMQYLQAKSNYEAQQQAVKSLKSKLAKTKVIAPFSGVIDDIITEQGSVVAPGQSQLMRIVNLDNMYIETDVPESYISDVVVNKNVQIDIPILGRKVDAKIRQTSNFINPANRTFKIQVDIPNPEHDIKPNLTARLLINDYTNEKALLIPQSIVSEDSKGQQYIYVTSNKNESNAVTERKVIKTGRTQGDVIEVLSGLDNNSEIIIEGARSVKAGQKVKIINK